MESVSKSVVWMKRVRLVQVSGNDGADRASKGITYVQ